jgi:hypothetical protein
MSLVNILRRTGVAVLTLALTAPLVSAQDQQTQKQSERKRNQGPELKKAYKDWIEKDVA